jgi:hypothetical protein
MAANFIRTLQATNPSRPQFNLSTMFKFDFGVVSIRKNPSSVIVVLTLPQDDEEDGQVTVQDSAVSDDVITGESSTSGAKFRTIGMDELVKTFSPQVAQRNSLAV